MRDFGFVTSNITFLGVFRVVVLMIIKEEEFMTFRSKFETGLRNIVDFLCFADWC